MFGNSKRECLGKFLDLECGIPDACTFRNVIKEIDTQKLHIIFCKWMKSVVSELTGVIIIDRKTARRTRDKSKRPLHVVSAFSYECGLVMGQLTCEEKSNEISVMIMSVFVRSSSACFIFMILRYVITLIPRFFLIRRHRYSFDMRNSLVICSSVIISL